MTNKKKKKKRGGATRGQLALIGVLSIVLVMVIAVQFSGSSSSKRSHPKTESNRSPGSTVATATIDSQQSAPDEMPREWPELSVDAVAQFDPLATPVWYQQAFAVEKRLTEQQVQQAETEPLQLEDMQATGAQIVLISGGQRIAKVGDQRVEIGDRIDGYQVSDIDNRGITLIKSRAR